MGHHRHLTLEQREMIMAFHAQGKTVTEIAKEIGKDKSTVSRELKRNRNCKGRYVACTAQYKYQERRRLCHRNLRLSDKDLFDKVRSLFVDRHWSPEQIAERMRLEAGTAVISTSTIYRAIYRHLFDLEPLSHGNRGLIRKLRHRGKTRHRKGTVETRGKIRVSRLIDERPVSAEKRSRRGHWEGDTVAGAKDKACLVTMVDRKTRFLLCRKAESKTSSAVGAKMRQMFEGQPLLSITLDRGKEFSNHEELTRDLGVEFYFPLPHHPWDRGTNENTNGLLREYFPKGQDITNVGDEEVSFIVDQLNRRPRKCLGFRTPYEVHYSKTLHLI
ncbi:MAG: IS30 family transposase [Spirochaetales bacterium]|nr:IS30 family transposase [Candidatus Physcosoma equi]